MSGEAAESLVFEARNVVDWNRPIRIQFDESRQRWLAGLSDRAVWGRTAKMLRPQEFPVTRASLIASIRDGVGASTWQDFFRHYAPAVFRVALQRGMRRDEADDIVQQVMITVVRRIGAFDYDRDRGQFRSWVRTIADNKILEHRRKFARDARTALAAAAEQPVETDDETWQREWRSQDLMHCMEELMADVPLRHLEAFRMYVVERRPVEEVARRMDLSVGNVYVIRTRIIKRLRQRMCELGGAGEC